MKLKYLLFLLLFAAIGCDFGPRFKGEVDIFFDDIKGHEKGYQEILEARLKKMEVGKFEIAQIEGGFHINMQNIKDTLYVVKMLQFNEVLGFWETYELTEVYPMLDKLDIKLAALQQPEITDSANFLMNESLQILSPEKSHPLWSKLQLNVAGEGRDISLPLGCLIGYAKQNDIILIDSMIRFGQRERLFPNDLVFKWGLRIDDTSLVMPLLALKKNPETGGPFMDNDEVKSSKLIDEPKQKLKRKRLRINLTKEGTKTFEYYTRKNQQKAIAFLLNEQVIMYPIVQGAISGGKVEVTGGASNTDETFKIINYGLQMPLYKTRPLYLNFQFEKK